MFRPESKLTLPILLAWQLGFTIDLLADSGNKDFLRQHRLFPSVNVGAATILNDTQLASNYFTGYLVGISAGYSMAMENFSLDLNLGWSSTSISVEAGEELKNNQPDVPSVIDTSFGEAGAAARIVLSEPFEAGFAVLMPFGVDTTFAPYEDPDDSPNFFFGLDFLFNQSGKGQSVTENLRYGVQLLMDLNISDRDVFFARATLGYNFPVSMTPRYKIKIKEKIRTKKIVKYKTKIREKIVTQYKDKYLIDAGIVYFETGKSDLPVMVQNYIEALARYLKINEGHWAQIMITSHTDKRGSDKLNDKLSDDRNKAISKILTENGISLERLLLQSMANKVPVQKGSSALELARNRRVEITISGPQGMKKLKAKILLLMQRYKLPTTCDDDDCR